MKILVFGRTGQVARELQLRAPEGVAITALGREMADLSDPPACAAVIVDANCDVVINAAAWTAVDSAEAEEQAATIVNSDAPTAMAQAAADRGLPFLHLSTDYVFGGAGNRPFAPDHPTGPLGAYGRSKLKGEVGVREAGGQHLILRTSWVVSSHGANFVKTMLRVGRERDRLRIVADQVGGPTPAVALADALFILAQALKDGAPSGTHHFAGAPNVSWADFARTIMARAELNTQIEGVPSSAYPTLAKRPINSRLDCTSLAAFGLSRPDWEVGLADILADLGNTT